MYDTKKAQTLVDYLESTSISNLIDEFDIEVDIKGRCSCLLHEETKPSMFIDFQKNKWHCFSCQQGGGVSSLIDHFYRHNLGTKNYYDSLNKYLEKHQEISKEIGFHDIITNEYQLSDFSMQNIIERCNKLEVRPNLTKIKIVEKPKKDASFEDILEYVTRLQTGG